MKVPKKWECPDCGFISNRSKTLKIGGLGFARCLKCNGLVKARAEWRSWLRKEQEKFWLRKEH